MTPTSNINAKLNELLSTSQRKSYFVGFVTVLFILIMTLGGILPAYSAFTFQNEENSKRDQVIDALTAKLNTVKSLTKESQDKASEVEYFNEIFPSEPNQDEIYTLINTMVNANNLYFGRITFRKLDTIGLAPLLVDENVGGQEANLLLQGDRDNLLNFVKDMESNRRIMNIIGVSIDRKSDEQLEEEASGDGGGAGSYSLIMQFQFYYYQKLEDFIFQ